MRFFMVFGLLFAFAPFFNLTVQAQDKLLFSAPVACKPFQECVIQQYVDLDPSSQTKDFHCGKSTYDGHKGTDFRITNAKAYHQGIDVIAVADGTVLRMRDGIRDKLMVSARDSLAVKGKECGNGLVIDHGDGWQSQYCHLKRGSLSVKRGQKVYRGDKLGLVGLSGKTQMPHVHVTFRYLGKVVDPFLGLEHTENSCGVSPDAVWRESVLAAFPYLASHILEAGFTSHLFQSGKREARLYNDRIEPSSSKLLFFVRLMNFKKGDQLQLQLKGPKAVLAARTYGPLDRDKARYVAIVGRKLKAAQWPAGRYIGQAMIIRNGKILKQETKVLDLR